jgi:hypothetical protein
MRVGNSVQSTGVHAEDKEAKMRTFTVLIAATLIAPLSAPAQDIDAQFLAKVYSDRYCNRVTGNATNRSVNSTNFGAFWEKELAKSLYKQVLVVPPGGVEEGKAKKFSKACKSPWYYVDPARSRQMTYEPDAIDEALQGQCLKGPVFAYFEAVEPIGICGGAADNFQRKAFTLHYQFSVSASDRQGLDAARDGKTPFRMTIVHLKEMRLADKDIYIHLTGVWAQDGADPAPQP